MASASQLEVAITVQAKTRFAIWGRVNETARCVRAAQAVAMREVAAFLREQPREDLGLLLVEPAGEARTALEAAHAAEPGLDADLRFRMLDAEATPDRASLAALGSRHQRAARFVANTANHKLSAKGGGATNQAV